MAASTAFPPFFKMSTPTCEASGFAAATTPFVALAPRPYKFGGFAPKTALVSNTAATKPNTTGFLLCIQTPPDRFNHSLEERAIPRV
ncbi:MAG: hypothetical protein BWX67_02274 [Thermotogae bacterium ADurb.Bin062]|nr:MAG: hypothetical protein BWX67_02274 [Thermotogota bacterium ADurb.Bin062]